MEPGTYPLVCSADFYHLTPGGEYEYRPENAPRAHAQCLLKFQKALGDPLTYDAILVDNTNTTAWEIAPYYQLAGAYGLDVEVVHVQTPFALCVSRQTHGVPLETMAKMYANLRQELPPFWRVRRVEGL